MPGISSVGSIQSGKSEADISRRKSDFRSAGLCRELIRYCVDCCLSHGTVAEVVVFPAAAKVEALFASA